MSLFPESTVMAVKARKIYKVRNTREKKHHEILGSCGEKLESNT
jgi:hypothetical protein